MLSLCPFQMLSGDLCRGGFSCLCYLCARKNWQNTCFFLKKEPNLDRTGHQYSWWFYFSSCTWHAKEPWCTCTSGWLPFTHFTRPWHGETDCWNNGEFLMSWFCFNRARLIGTTESEKFRGGILQKHPCSGAEGGLWLRPQAGGCKQVRSSFWLIGAQSSTYKLLACDSNPPSSIACLS